MEVKNMNTNPIQYTIPVYKLKLVREGRAKTMPVTGPAELAFHLKEIATADREHMVVIFLDTKNRPIGRQVVSIGTLNATLVHPREVFKAALITGGTNAVILAHNHPSGDLSPSREDDEVTRKIARAGALLCIPLLDHIILAPDGAFYSYKDNRPDCLNGGGPL
jgi:DNA repair protein RadC